MSWLHGATAALVAVIATAGAARAAEPRAVSTPETGLVLLVAVDQLRRDRLDPSLPGGLGRIAREGRVHVDAALAHAATETCPGHASMLSGRHPGRLGVPGNVYVDRESGERIYCVEDRAPDARVFGAGDAPEDGRSPRKIRGDALGDWMKAVRPGTRVFSVSGKDRAAIAMAGQRPDAVYWLLREGTPGFTTSAYYREALPDWVEAWRGEAARTGFLSSLPRRWEHEAAGAGGERADDHPAELSEFGRTSGHPVHDDDLETFVERVSVTPFIDDWTLAFAAELARREALGREGLDLLAVSLSGTDLVGHAYGPESWESRAALLQLDRSLAGFLDLLAAEIGPGRVWTVLTADHGVLPLPEWLVETGRSECPVEGGRVSLLPFAIQLLAALHFEHSVFGWPQAWLGFGGSQASVVRRLARDRGVEVEAVAASAERWLEERPVVREVWTRAEIEAREGPLAQLYRNGLDAERSGDLMVQIEPTCLLAYRDAGTSHGSPYPYDRDVPIVFHGPGIEAARVRGPAATVDIAPSLAALLGIPTPPDLDGRSLLP